LKNITFFLVEKIKRTSISKSRWFRSWCYAFM